MKRFLLSTLAILISLGTLAATANAKQVDPRNEVADANGDGVTTLDETRNYNRDQRDGYSKD
jgi:hypothetical protein